MPRKYSDAVINRIRLSTAYPFGPGQITEQSIGVDSSLSYGQKSRPVITFDVDPRFIRVEFGEWVDLVPLSNVAGIYLQPAG